MRMKFFLGVMACWFCAASSLAVTYPFESYTEPFYSPKIPIVWEATNRWPAKVKILEVVPASFSQSAISNLTAMGGSAFPKRGTMNLYKPRNARPPFKDVPDESVLMNWARTFWRSWAFRRASWNRKVTRCRRGIIPGRLVIEIKSPASRRTNQCPWESSFAG